MRPEEVHVPPTRTPGPHDLRPPSIGLAEGCADDPVEVPVGWAVLGVEPRAARCVRAGPRQRERGPRAGGIHLKPLDARLFELAVLIMRAAQPIPEPMPAAIRTHRWTKVQEGWVPK